MPYGQRGCQRTWPEHIMPAAYKVAGGGFPAAIPHRRRRMSQHVGGNRPVKCVVPARTSQGLIKQLTSSLGNVAVNLHQAPIRSANWREIPEVNLMGVRDALYRLPAYLHPERF